MKTTTKYSKGGKAVGVKKKSATMHIPATPAGSNKARIAAIGTPKKSGTKAAVVMKKGGTKKPLRKAQYGDGMIGTPSLKDVGVKNVYEGPLNKSDYENLNKLYPVNNETPRLESTVMAPSVLQKDKSIKGPKVRMSQSAGNQYMQNRVANYLRSGRTLDSDSELGVYAPKEKDLYSVEGKKKGGAVKKTLSKAQDGKIIKSKKVRTADINTFGSSTTNVSKTKRDGSTVTKSIKTNQGYAPTQSATKTVTDKSGKSTTTTKDIGWNKALRKQARITKKVGRNPNDQLSGDNYKKGGATKSTYKKGGAIKATAKKVMVKSKKK